MPTVSEIDGKLDELKRQAAALKEQRKVAAAKEREQARKWKAATLAAIGETVLKTLGADWTAIDLEGLQGWLAESAEDIRLMAVTDTRTPVEAKEALDAFKRSSKPKRTEKPDAVEDVTEYLWKMFPFMSLRQATAALRELREGGLIAEREYDGLDPDCRNWYTLTETGSAVA